MSDLATRQLMHRLGERLRQLNLSIGWAAGELTDEVAANAFLATDLAYEFLRASREATEAMERLGRQARELGCFLQERAKHVCPTCRQNVPLPDADEESAE